MSNAQNLPQRIVDAADAIDQGTGTTASWAASLGLNAEQFAELVPVVRRGLATE